MTRQEAALRNLKQYTPAEPCKKRGHYSPRYVSNNGCIACMKENVRPFRSNYGGDVAHYATTALHSCKLLTPEHREGLDHYLQECIYVYLMSVKGVYDSDTRIRIVRCIQDIKDAVAHTTSLDRRNVSQAEPVKADAPEQETACLECGHRQKVWPQDKTEGWAVCAMCEEPKRIL
jgi:hypothetical protein